MFVCVRGFTLQLCRIDCRVSCHPRAALLLCTHRLIKPAAYKFSGYLLRQKFIAKRCEYSMWSVISAVTSCFLEFRFAIKQYDTGYSSVIIYKFISVDYLICRKILYTSLTTSFKYLKISCKILEFYLKTTSKSFPVFIYRQKVIILLFV